MTSAAALRTLASVHAALAWLSLAGLAAALLVLWRRRAAALFVLPAAALLAAAAFATGAMLHGPFQRELRQRLFLEANALGWLFERKEHVAFGALALSWCALFAFVAERTLSRGEAARVTPLRWACLIGLGAALAFELFAAVVSVAAARHVGF